MSIERFEISANIRNYLDAHKVFVIRKVGKFIFEDRKAEFHTHSGLVLPPGKKISFEEGNFSDETSFVPFLASKIGTTVSKAGQLWDQWNLELTEQLEEEGVFQLPGLGKLVKRNNNITFITDQKSVAKYDYGLPEIKLHPRVNPTKSGNFKTKKSEFKSSSDKKDTKVTPWLRIIWDIIGTAAIIALLIIGYQSFQRSILNPPVTDTEIIDQGEKLNPLNAKPSSLFINGSEVEEGNLIPGIIKEEQPIASCALILGSFTKERNASRMQRLVLETGYELFTEQYQEFIRIGISVPCDKVNGQLFKSIEEITGIDPWLRIYSQQ